MSEQEEFLKRWSRRKQEAEAEAKAGKTTPEESKAEPTDKPPGKEIAGKPDPAAPMEEDVALDPESFPSLDSITAESDIRAFLAPGVPDQLKYAALRKMWTADPDIRDFIGLVENGWDFNAPNSAHGFGPLEVTEELKRAVAGMFERATKASELQEPAAETNETKERNIEAPAQSVVALERSGSKHADEINNQLSAKQSAPIINAALPQETGGNEKPNNRSTQRGHGGALPK